MVKISLRSLIFLICLFLVGVAYATNQALTVTNVLPTSGENYTNGEMLLNVTVSPDTNATKCQYVLGLSNGTNMASVLLSNDTSNNASFSNSSAFNPNIETNWNKYHNITFQCYNGSDWYNTSAISFGFDNTSPTIDGISSTIKNTTEGNYLQPFIFNVTDNNTDLTEIRIHNSTGSLIYTRYPSRKEVALDARHEYNVTSADFSYDGKWVFTPWANDSMGNSVSGTNQSYLAYNLKTGWNLIQIPQNLTLDGIASMHPNITSVAAYNNTGKSYTTYVVGVSSNSGYATNMTNATYVYVNEDTLLLSKYYTVPNAYKNVSLETISTSDWNQIGMVDTKTLNETLYASGITNETSDSNSAYTSANITFVSYYNATLGKYCSAYRGYTATSCSPDYNVTDIYVMEGQGLWIAVDANLTFDRGGI